jgi:ATP-binding cassette subfamily B protein
MRLFQKSFPFLEQLDSNDCGIACLRMVAAYYGKPCPSSALTEFGVINNQGVSFHHISQLADMLGFRSLCIWSTIDKLSMEVSLPVIVHWNQNHFVVVYKIERNKVFVADPAFGLVSYSIPEFLKAWIGSEKGSREEGAVLLLETTPGFHKTITPPVNKKPRFTLFKTYLAPYRLHLFSLAAGLIVGSFLELLFPFFTQAIIDKGIGHQNISFVCFLLGAQLSLFLGKSVSEFLRERIFMHISSRISVLIISDFLVKLMKLPVSFFGARQMGDLIQRIQDHSRVEKFMSETVLKSVFAVFTLIVLSVILFHFSSPSFLLFITCSSLEFIWILSFIDKLKIVENKNFALLAQDQNKIHELIQAMPEIKLHNLEQKKRMEWENIQVSLFRLNLNKLKLNQWYECYHFLTYIQRLLVTLFTSIAAIHGQLSLGSMMAVLFVLGQMNEPISQLINFILQANYARISMLRLNEIRLKENEEREEMMKRTQLPVFKDIHLHELSFQYPGMEQQVLSGISMHIPANKTTAIVGVSGSGKTTLLKLLLKFYKPQSGSITLGGYNLATYKNDFWRSCCGAVLQDSFLFADTIAGNIALEDPPDLARLHYACFMAHIQDFVKALPRGYKTKIGQDGQGLSQGQRQRILIARTIYKNPAYVFFDEATNALDAENELYIMNNLESFFRSRTVVIVAHRLSTVKHADQIIVMDKGGICESGTHRDLIISRGRYYRLIKDQLELGA